MKQLLYIPTGSYVAFRYYNGPLISFEEFYNLIIKENNDKYKNHEDMVNRICKGSFANRFYGRNDIKKPVLLSEFEFIEVEDK